MFDEDKINRIKKINEISVIDGKDKFKISSEKINEINHSYYLEIVKNKYINKDFNKFWVLDIGKLEINNKLLYKNNDYYVDISFVLYGIMIDDKQLINFDFDFILFINNYYLINVGEFIFILENIESYSLETRKINGVENPIITLEIDKEMEINKNYLTKIIKIKSENEYDNNKII